VWANTAGEYFRIHAPQTIYRQIRKRKSTLLQRSTRIQYGGVLSTSGDNMMATRAVATGVTTDREVDRLGAPTGEDEVERIGRPDQSSHVCAGILNGHTRLTPLPMNAGGVPPY
jgi:hypothetical protein